VSGTRTHERELQIIIPVVDHRRRGNELHLPENRKTTRCQSRPTMPAPPASPMTPSNTPLQSHRHALLLCQRPRPARPVLSVHWRRGTDNLSDYPSIIPQLNTASCAPATSSSSTNPLLLTAVRSKGVLITPDARMSSALSRSKNYSITGSSSPTTFSLL
jgi:hypothetical protein